MRRVVALALILLQPLNAWAGSQTLLKGDILEASTSGRIGATGAPDTKAVLDLVSTTLGFLPPRMTTTQKNAITSPTTGLIVYDTTLPALQVYNGSAWISAGGGGISYAADTGSANAYAIAPTPAAIAYTTGDIYSFKVANANTTSSTLNVSALGTKNILTPQLGALPAGALAANAIALVVYDGTQFQLVNAQDPTRVSPLTTKGDVHTFSTVNIRQAVPGDYGRLVPDSTTSTGWRSASYTQYQSGAPTVNYVQFADFENNSTTGWTAVGCATLSAGIPTCVGSAGAAFSSSNGGRAKNANTASPAIDSSSAIAGTYAMNLATTGAGAAGDGYVSSAYTLDPKVRGTALGYTIPYKVASGTPAQTGASTDTYAVGFYDLANNTFITPSAPFCVTKASGVGTCQGTFSTSTTTTQIQAFVYSPVAPAGVSSLLFDDVSIGIWISAQGAPVTDPVAYTPTFTNLSIGNGTQSFQWQRIGPNIKIIGAITVGSTTSITGTIVIGLPSGVTLVSSSNGATGTATAYHGAAAQYVGGMWALSTTTLIAEGPPAGYWNATNPITWATNDQATFTFTAPVSGWSSSMGLASSTNNSNTISAVTTSAHSGGMSANTTGTYTPPAGVKWIEILMWGGGGGGGGSGTTSGTAATNGTSTTFGTSLLTAPGGSLGARGAAGGVGGVAPTISAPASDIDSGVGNDGGGAFTNGAVTTQGSAGGTGGASGQGFGGTTGGAGAATGGGGAAAANTGGGGGGASEVNISSGQAGSGGGGGAYVHAQIVNPAASYTYTVGAKGTGQAAGTSGAAGGNGADGKIIVVEHYLPNPTIGIDPDNYTSVSANYTVGATDRTIAVTSTATLTFPAPAQVSRRIYHVIGNGAAATISPASGTVCGQATMLVPNGESVDIQSDGTNYQGINGACFAQETVLGDQSAACTTGTCTSTSKSGGMSSVSFSSTGIYSINFVAGTFSAAPVCSPSASRNNAVFCVTNQSRTSSAVLVGCYLSNTAAATNDNITAICRGPR